MNVVKEKNLNPKQELFCQLYATEREFFGNGVDSYVEAYDVDLSKKNAYKSAAASASRLLKNVNIIEKINKLLEDANLNDMFVDKQLGFLIIQHADFSTKLGAIKEYNNLKKRIVNKVEGNLQVETKSTLDDSQKAIIAEIFAETMEKWTIPK